MIKYRHGTVNMNIKKSRFKIYVEASRLTRSPVFCFFKINIFQILSVFSVYSLFLQCNLPREKSTLSSPFASSAEPARFCTIFLFMIYRAKRPRTACSAYLKYTLHHFCFLFLQFFSINNREKSPCRFF